MTEQVNDSGSYRDDRMYVMRLTSEYTVSDDGLITASMRRGQTPAEDKPILLITYRNTQSLPAVRTDEFSSLREALDYLIAIEPQCPRLSLNGKGPNPALTWEEHLTWLHSKGLKSAAEGDDVIPDWVENDKNPREQFLRQQK
jgi:hypothetical protein